MYKVLYLRLNNTGNVKIGKKVGIKKNVKFMIGDKANLMIGNGVFFNNGCSINCLKNISIGENSILGENVKIYDHNHKYRDRNKLIKEQGFNIGNVCIGSNCWIGSNVTILNNVSIGDNVIIGANCLIYESIPSNKIVKCKSELIIDSVDIL